MRHHETYEKFGGDANRIAAYEHWSVLIRQAQATKGAMVMIAHANVTKYSDLPAEAFSEMAQVIRDIERALGTAFQPDKMNYLMLMMVDPHVHYHVIPRYGPDHERQDPGWPGPPSLGVSVEADPADVCETLRSVWGRT
jgi:diadenosine tetraphosphate (Ap4A) HIT family hydrolase